MGIHSAAKKDIHYFGRKNFRVPEGACREASSSSLLRDYEGEVMGGIYQYLDQKFRERIMELEKSGDIKDLQRKKDTAENGIHINKGPGRKH